MIYFGKQISNKPSLKLAKNFIFYILFLRYFEILHLKDARWVLNYGGIFLTGESTGSAVRGQIPRSHNIKKCPASYHLHLDVSNITIFFI